MRCVHLFASVDYNISNESLKKNNIRFRQARKVLCTWIVKLALTVSGLITLG